MIELLSNVVFYLIVFGVPISALMAITKFRKLRHPETYVRKDHLSINASLLGRWAARKDVESFRELGKVDKWHPCDYALWMHARYKRKGFTLDVTSSDGDSDKKFEGALLAGGRLIMVGKKMLTTWGFKPHEAIETRITQQQSLKGNNSFSRVQRIAGAFRRFSDNNVSRIMGGITIYGLPDIGYGHANPNEPPAKANLAEHYESWEILKYPPQELSHLYQAAITAGVCCLFPARICYASQTGGQWVFNEQILDKSWEMRSFDAVMSACKVILKGVPPARCGSCIYCANEFRELSRKEKLNRFLDPARE